jgi:DNA-binding winged helix-turn-helix (wHTH) protein
METKDSPLPKNQKLVIDLSARRVWQGKRELGLTPLEYRVLAYLAQRVGEVVTYAEIWQRVWADSGSFGIAEREVVRTTIKRLRRKLEKDPKHPAYLVGQRGVGVRLQSELISLEMESDSSRIVVPKLSQSDLELFQTCPEILMQTPSIGAINLLNQVKVEVWQMKKQLFLAFAGLIAALSILVAITAFLPPDSWQVTLRVRDTVPPAVREIPQGGPMLGAAANEEYLGQVIVEVWDKDAFVSNTIYPDNPQKTIELLSRATTTLRNPTLHFSTAIPLPNQANGEIPSGKFLGQVVVEVWSNQVQVAIRGAGQEPYLAKRAAERLEQVIKYY